MRHGRILPVLVGPSPLRAGAAMLATASALAAVLASPALAATSASVSASLARGRPGGGATATIALRFSGGAEHVPAPLSAMVLRLTAGLHVDLSGVGVCQASSLRRRGAAGCSAASLIGRGQAVLEVHAGSQTVPENSAISVFRGPNRGAQPSFEILGEGKTPLDERAVSTAILQSDSSPYGSKLIVSVPPIPTLAYEPNASFLSLSLTIGNAGTRSRGVIVLPKRCPAGGFPLAASFSFADRTSASASTTAPCLS